LRPDRDAAPVVAGEGVIVPPLSLGDDERLIFTELVRKLEEQKRADPHHAEHLELAAIRIAQVRRFKAVLETVGDTYEVRGMYRKRPEVEMLSDALRHAQSLLGELMLNPSAAMRIGEAKKDEEDGFAALLG
jgi:phage terminase small subunit